MRRAVGGLAVLTALALGACKQADKAPRPGAAGSGLVDILAPAEKLRSTSACGDYAAKVCGCAERTKTTAHEDACKMARALPDALALNLEIAGHPDTNRTTQAQLQRTVRNIAAQCIAGLGTLAADGCPMPGVGGNIGMKSVLPPAAGSGSGAGSGSSASSSGSGSSAGSAAVATP